MLIIVHSPIVYAHSGGLNKNNCHTNSKIAISHCHKQPFENLWIIVVIIALVVLLAIILYLWHKQKLAAHNQTTTIKNIKGSNIIYVKNIYK